MKDWDAEDWATFFLGIGAGAFLVAAALAFALAALNAVGIVG